MIAFPWKNGCTSGKLIYFTLRSQIFPQRPKSLTWLKKKQEAKAGFRMILRNVLDQEQANASMRERSGDGQIPEFRS